MGDMKDKFKGFMKKVNNQLSSSSSGKFKGQGRVLGSSSSGNVDPIHTRYNPPQSQNPKPKPPSSSSSSATVANSNHQPSPQKILDSNQEKFSSATNLEPDRKPAEGFDPFGSLITSSKRSQHGYSLNVFECPVCGNSFASEEEVSVHLESCLDSNKPVETDNGDDSNEINNKNEEVEIHVKAFLSGKPPEGSVDVVLRLLRNIVKEPENAKFRKIRMNNPKIKEAVGDVKGGSELLEFVGFELKEENGEIWAAMEVPERERIRLINEVIGVLEPKKIEEPKRVSRSESATPAVAEQVKAEAEPKKIDRQTRVFFAVPESVAARIQLPDSFYNLSAEEVKREAELRRKKIADSQLLIPKSYREKQAKAARKRYRRTVIRVQFPDGVVLQGVFAPWEPTTALYEFVSLALKEPGLQFELLDPVLVKRRVIPRFTAPGEKARTLDEEDLVPSALIKFRPNETEDVVFTGLSNKLLQVIEPLVNDSAVAPARVLPENSLPLWEDISI